MKELSKCFLPTSYTELARFAEVYSESNLCPKEFKGHPNNVLVAMITGHELGLSITQAPQNIAVINGRPSVWGDALKALVMNNPLCEWIKEYMKDGVAYCVVKRRNYEEHTQTFSVEDAKRAGLWGKQGPWTQYPNRMLQMRARGFALRDIFPDVLKGIITTEEALDMPIEKDITAQVKIVEKDEPVHVIEYLSDKLDHVSNQEDMNSFIKNVNESALTHQQKEYLLSLAKDKSKILLEQSEFLLQKLLEEVKRLDKTGLNEWKEKIKTLDLNDGQKAIAREAYIAARDELKAIDEGDGA